MKAFAVACNQALPQTPTAREGCKCYPSKFPKIFAYFLFLVHKNKQVLLVLLFEKITEYEAYPITCIVFLFSASVAAQVLRNAGVLLNEGIHVTGGKPKLSPEIIPSAESVPPPAVKPLEPAAVTISDIDKVLLDFVATTSSNRTLLDCRLAQNCGRVEWDGGTDGITISYSVTSSTSKDSWSDDVRRVACDVFGLFEQHTLQIPQEFWECFLERVGPYEQTNDDVRVIVNDDFSVDIVGKTIKCREIKDLIEKVSTVSIDNTPKIFCKSTCTFALVFLA